MMIMMRDKTVKWLVVGIVLLVLINGGLFAWSLVQKQKNYDPAIIPGTKGERYPTPLPESPTADDFFCEQDGMRYKNGDVVVSDSKCLECFCQIPNVVCRTISDDCFQEAEIID